MTNGIKISQLDAASTLVGTESIPIVQSGNTVKATANQIKTLAQTAIPAANVVGTLTAATVPAANVSGALTNATISVTGITGTLGINQGGTGQTTANAAFNALAPSQTSNANKYLKTNGSNTSWGTPSGSDISIGVGSTAVTGGTSGRVLYDNAGSVGEYTTTGTAGSVVLSNQPTFDAGTITGAVNIATFSTTATTSASINLANASTASGAAVRLLTNLSGVTNGFTAWGTQYNSGSPFAYVAVGAGVTGGLQLQTNTRITGTTQLDSTLTYGGLTFASSTTGGNGGSLVSSISPQFTTGIGVGRALATSTLISIGGNVGTTTDSVGVSNAPTIQSASTNSYVGYYSAGNTQATAFTLASVRHFQTNGITLGSGSALPNQYGFFVESTFTQATNNYGFYGGIASGTGRYNLYMAGTADNYLGGKLGIGVTPSADRIIAVGMNPTGATNTYGQVMGGTIQSDVTSNHSVYYSGPTTQATAFTLNSIRHFTASSPATFGSGSTVTNQYGFIAESTLTGATNNYGFYSGLASGTNRWNFYAGGTAQNFFNGTTLFGNDVRAYYATAITAGGTTGAGYKFSSTSNFGMFFGSGVPTLSAAQGSLYLRSDGTPYYNTNGTTGWSALVTASTLKINIQTFTSSGTYTPTSGLVYAIIEVVGGGGGGGSCSGAALSSYAGGGGGGGGYARKIASAATIGSSQTVTIGAGGGSSSAGGSTSVGSLCVAGGGSGGTQSTAGAGGTGTTGDVFIVGGTGGTGNWGGYQNTAGSGSGGGTPYGGGAAGFTSATSGAVITGTAATGYGGGGSGGLTYDVALSASGGAGKSGIVVITEFYVG